MLLKHLEIDWEILLAGVETGLQLGVAAFELLFEHRVVLGDVSWVDFLPA